MDYIAIKYLHIAAVSVSIIGFVLRFVGTQLGAGWAISKVARTVPHINDTVLLLSAVTLAVLSGMNPLSQPWLMAKIIALLVYIGLGMFALKPSRSRGVRVVSGVLAMVVFSYIVSVAFGKQVSGWFGVML